MKRGGPSGPPLYSLEVETEHTEHFAVSNVYHGDSREPAPHHRAKLAPLYRAQKIAGMT